MLQKCAAAGSNKNLRPKVTLQSIHPPTPFQLTMGYVYVEPSSGRIQRYQYILVIMDHYIRFAEAYPTRDQTAADRLCNDFIMRFGFPEITHNDKGENSKISSSTTLRS